MRAHGGVFMNDCLKPFNTSLKHLGGWGGHGWKQVKWRDSPQTASFIVCVLCLILDKLVWSRLSCSGFSREWVCISPSQNIKLTEVRKLSRGCCCSMNLNASHLCLCLGLCCWLWEASCTYEMGYQITWIASLSLDITVCTRDEKSI